MPFTSTQNTPHAVHLVRRTFQHVFPSDEYVVDESYAETTVYDADEPVSVRGHSLSVSDLLP